MYKKYIKRLLDIVLAVFSITLLSPIFLIISIVVRIQMGSPILFFQERIGINEEIFRLYKFRSMTNATDMEGNLLPDEERLTKFGVILRSTSLDELPELFMILTGKMSFVGPRPQPKACGPYYTEEERIAHTVRGGLIPPDCLSLEVQCDWEEQLKYESWYAENTSFLLDVKIILCTFVIILKRMKTSYGADDRPELYEYRKNMVISEETKQLWKNKGVDLK